MNRRYVIGTLAAAALLTGSAAIGSVPRAQAQGSDCMAEFGTVGTACGEIRFNMSPTADTMPPAPELANPGMPMVATGQPGTIIVAGQSGADQSQAGPGEEAQPGGSE